jgi:formylglycine-generating enzyme required for sulfatase activity
MSQKARFFPVATIIIILLVFIIQPLLTGEGKNMKERFVHFFTSLKSLAPAPKPDSVAVRSDLEKIRGSDGIEMVFIPGGTFIMGSIKDQGDEDESPQHEVFVNGYYIDVHEVTNREYKKFVDATGHRVPFVDAEWAAPYNWTHGTYPEGRGDYPVVLVSWDDAKAYADYVGERLPTEAEWEKAARGGLVAKSYPWGEGVDETVANYHVSDTAKEDLRPVMSYPPNSFGLYDMAGNVWEWCSDWYDYTIYREKETQNLRGSEKGYYRVYRGGSWINPARFLRCAERGKNLPETRSYVIGFRCVKSVQDTNNGTSP